MIGKKREIAWRRNNSSTLPSYGSGGLELKELMEESLKAHSMDPSER